MERPFPSRPIWLFAALAALAVVAAVALWPSQPGPSGPAPEPVATPETPTRIELHDVTDATGVLFRHTDGESGRHYIVETVSAGLALFDYDGDGRVDIYFVNGRPLFGAKADPPPRNALYRNLGGWKFEDVTDRAGVGDAGYGLGVAVGDYDNDGRPDLYVTNYGPNVLYRNNGDGTFTDVTQKAGVAGLGKAGAGACFLDADGDGDLDLYVANYLDFTQENHVEATLRGVAAYASPDRYPPLPGLLFRNNGDGAFTDVSRETGIGRHASWGMGVVAADYDDDGDTDIFVANDVSANFLFENDGAGKFREVGALAGTAYDVYGSPQGSMGVDCGDFDNDGRLDFYQTSYQMQHAVLYRNLGRGMFEDVSQAAGAAAGTFNHVTWGNGFVDFDHDGDRDLFVACGHLQDRVEEYDGTTSYRARNLVLMNVGDGKYVNVSDRCGDGLAVAASSRGAAFADLDNDGDVDVVVLNSRGRPTLLRNMLVERGDANHWLQVRLVGRKTNRDGVGARVTVRAGDLTLVDEVHAGRGYQSHWGPELHFGLGPRNRIDAVEVRWIGGAAEVFTGVEVDRKVSLLEGQGRPK